MDQGLDLETPLYQGDDLGKFLDKKSLPLPPASMISPGRSRNLSCPPPVRAATLSNLYTSSK